MLSSSLRGNPSRRLLAAMRSGAASIAVPLHSSHKGAALYEKRRFAATAPPSAGTTRPPVHWEGPGIAGSSSRSQNSWDKHKYASAGVVALSAWLLKQGQDQAEGTHCDPRVPLKHLAPPPDAVIHPMEGKPWQWRWMFTIWRGIRLCLLFTPVTAYSLAVYILPVPQEWRDQVPQMLVATLEKAGCSFQKIGQWLSMRPDVCPPDLIAALGKLRTNAPAHCWEDTEEAVKKAFQCERLSDIFEEFEHEPVASGSVAQVHRAKLRKEAKAKFGIDDEDKEFESVAVKVLHPLVMETTFTDIQIIFSMLNTVGRACFNMAMPFDESTFFKAMIRQLDLNWEAYNLIQFQENFAKDDSVRFPKVAYSTDQVLVESWMPGKSISNLFSEVEGENFLAKESAEIIDGMTDSKKKKLAGTIFDLTVKMFLRDNYIHGDMHGGNLMYSTDPDDERVIVLDAGLTTALEKDWASPFGYLLHALSTNDAEKVAEKLIQFNQGSTEVNSALVKSEIQQIMGEMYGSAGRSPVNMGAMIGNILTVLQKHNINLRGDVALTIVTMSISEGLIRSLDPGFDCVTSSLPYFVRYRSWQRASLTSNKWAESQAHADNGGLPQGGSRGHAVTSIRKEIAPLSNFGAAETRIAARAG